MSTTDNENDHSWIRYHKLDETHLERGSIASQCADQDRLSFIMNNKMDDLEQDMDDQKDDAKSTIFKKSKSLTAKHTLMSVRHRKQQESTIHGGDSYNGSFSDVSLLEDCDWHDIIV